MGNLGSMISLYPIVSHSITVRVEKQASDYFLKREQLTMKDSTFYKILGIYAITYLSGLASGAT